jgi:hypothetical protein
MSDYTVRGSSSNDYSALRLVSAALVFGSTTVDLDTLAAGEVVMQAWCQVTTAFNAGTTNVITLGDGTTANKYLAAADVTEGTPGVYPTGGAGPFAAETAAGTLRATYTQTGTAATTGAARVYALIASSPA